MSAGAKIRVGIAVVVSLVGIAVLASGSLVGLILLLIVATVVAIVVRRSGGEPGQGTAEGAES